MVETDTGSLSHQRMGVFMPLPHLRWSIIALAVAAFPVGAVMLLNQDVAVRALPASGLDVPAAELEYRQQRSRMAQREAEQRAAQERRLAYCGMLRPVARDAVLLFSTGSGRPRVREMLNVPEGVKAEHAELILDRVYGDPTYRDAERVQNLVGVLCMEDGWSAPQSSAMEGD